MFLQDLRILPLSESWDGDTHCVSGNAQFKGAQYQPIDPSDQI